jgi:hypothetical protein
MMPMEDPVVGTLIIAAAPLVCLPGLRQHEIGLGFREERICGV